jgi:dihydrolipoamide dehydrogenase
VSEPIEVRVPDIGDFTDVPIIEIHVEPGQRIAAEDPLVTLESDKATMDVPAPFGGTVRQLAVSIGDRVSEGSVLVVVEPEGSDQAEEAAPAAAAAPASAPAGAPASAPAGAPASAPAGAPASAPAGAPASAPAGAPASAPAGAPAPAPAPVAAGPPPAEGYEAQVVVIGSGPGGYTAAFRAADLGLKTILVERHETLGGVCLNVGCIPSKALLHAARVIAETQEMAERGIAFGEPKVDLERLLGWKQSVVDQLTRGVGGLARQRRVEVVRGEARFTGPHSLSVGDRTITFASAIIAVGSRAASLPFLPEDERIVDSTGALSPSRLPKRLLVIGGGIIGLEMAAVYDALGTRVSVVELLDQLIPGCDADLVRVLHKRVAERYEAVRTGVSVVSARAQRNGIKVELSDGSSALYEMVLVAVGRQPNGALVGAAEAGVHVEENGFIPVDGQMRTNVAHIHAIGDVVGGPMLAHKASHEGKVAAEAIAGVPGAQFDPRAIPSVAYTDPEVAWAGLTENEARAGGVEYETAAFPWAASGRALSLARSEGLTKLLFEPGSRRLLGAGIVGVGAGELIAEAVHALEMGADAEDLALSIHPHPTLSETLGFAAELATGTITDLAPRRRRS